MPYKSDKQRKFMHAKHPEIAKRWDEEYPESKKGQKMARNKDASFMDYMQGAKQGFNPYAAGQKRYGASARSAPNVGPTGSPEGYDMRERKNNAKRNAMLRKMKKGQSGNHMSADWMRRKNYSG